MFGNEIDLWRRRLPEGTKERALADRLFPVIAASYDWTAYKAAAEPFYKRFLARNRFDNPDSPANKSRATDDSLIDYIKYRSVGNEKFIFIEPWLIDKMRLFAFLNLHAADRSRVVDLGSAIGHFQMLCEAAGHETLGVDIPDDVFDTLVPILGLERVIEWVTPGFFEGGRRGSFDLITGFLVNFNIVEDLDGSQRLWTAEDWTEFLDGAVSALNPSGRLLLLLNPQNFLPGLKASDKSLPVFLNRYGFTVSLQQDRYYAIYRKADG